MRFRRRIRSSTRRSFPSKKENITMRAFSGATTRTAGCASTWAFRSTAFGGRSRSPTSGWRVRTRRLASGSTATILALRRSATNTTLRGATATTGRRSALRGRMISRRSTSLKTHFFPITATGFCSRARSGAGSRCCRVRATRVTRPSGTSSIRRAPTWSSGAATVM